MWRFVIPIAVVAPCAMIATVEAPPQAATWDFETAVAGELPNGWASAKTGQGDESTWKIVEDSSAPAGAKVLAQTAKSPGSMFNLCIANAATFKDVEMTVSFKAVAGRIDQGGGLVWRYLDANNYYVVRMNPLEGNFRLFKVENGNRSMIASKDGVAMSDGKWHTMSLTTKGQHIECSLDGRKYLEANDATFCNGGKVGLWTKADAQTYFDDLRVVAVR